MRYPFCFFSEASLPSSVSSTRVSIVIYNGLTTGNRQRSRCTPLVLPSPDLEVTSADVDGVGSMMDGLTIVPSVPSVYSLGSGTAPTPTSSVSDVRGSSFPLRSGGSRGDTISVLSALTAPAALTGQSMFGGIVGCVVVGDGGAGGGGVPSEAIRRCLNSVSTPCCC